MRKRPSRYIASFDYFEKSLIALSVKSGEFSIPSFFSVIGAPVSIASASFSFVFSLTKGIMEKPLKTTQNKNKKHDKISMEPSSKLNNLENIKSKVLIDNKVSHEDFTPTINDKNYRELNESIKMLKIKRSNTERNKLRDRSCQKNIH